MKRTLDILAVVSALVAAAVIALLALDAVDPVAVAGIGPVVAELMRSDNASAPTILAVAIGGAFSAFYFPRRAEKRGYVLAAASVLAGTAIVLGFASYVTTAAGQTPIWTPLAWTLGLFAGNTEVPFVGDAWPGGLPLALQVARLAALLAIFIAAVGTLVLLFRAQVDRVRVLLSSSVVLIDGVDDLTIPLVERIAAEHRSGKRGSPLVTVVVDDAGAGRLLALRARGVCLLELDWSNVRAVRAVAVTRGRPAVTAAYLLSAESERNASRIADLDMAFETARRPPSSAITLVTRIDDPWQAEYWRRERIPVVSERSDGTRAIVTVGDALSVHETTADAVIDHADDVESGAEPPAMVIAGASPLTLALCAELAQRGREDRVLRPATVRRRPVTIVGRSAAETARHHRLRQSRFGLEDEGLDITVVVAEVTEQTLADVMRPGSVLILAGRPTIETTEEANSLAASHPSWRIYAWAADGGGVPARPSVERLHAFGPTLLPSIDRGVGRWDRTARILHEVYLRTVAVPRDPQKESHRQWTELPPHIRESNIRQVTNLMLSMQVDLHRGWGPVDPAGPHPLTSAEIDRLAALEHASWSRQLLDAGWSAAELRDDTRRRHDKLVGWGELSPESRAQNRDAMASVLEQLGSLGYHPTSAAGAGTESAGDPVRWHRFRRVGTVRAVRLDARREWTTANGDVLTAESGDWWVTGDTGDSWSVGPEHFAQTYERDGSDVWRRKGTTLGREAVPGESIRSREGLERATAGDWIMSGSLGEEWIVRADHVAKAYHDDGPADPPDAPQNARPRTN
jgi:hypothetical protein